MKETKNFSLKINQMITLQKINSQITRLEKFGQNLKRSDANFKKEKRKIVSRLKFARMIKSIIEIGYTEETLGRMFEKNKMRLDRIEKEFISEFESKDLERLATSEVGKLKRKFYKAKEILHDQRPKREY